eukprot:5174767-Pleurochrysis_carterae.AAC.2
MPTRLTLRMLSDWEMQLYLTMIFVAALTLSMISWNQHSPPETFDGQASNPFCANFCMERWMTARRSFTRSQAPVLTRPRLRIGNSGAPRLALLPALLEVGLHSILGRHPDTAGLEMTTHRRAQQAGGLVAQGRHLLDSQLLLHFEDKRLVDFRIQLSVDGHERSCVFSTA